MAITSLKPTAQPTSAPSEAARQGSPVPELEGEVTLLQGGNAVEQIRVTEVTGGLIADTAVLAPEPRAVSACAGANGMRVLHLHGYAFRESLHANPIMTSEVIRLLAPRLHGRIGNDNPSSTPSEPCSAKTLINS